MAVRLLLFIETSVFAQNAKLFSLSLNPLVFSVLNALERENNAAVKI
jgi:hypothetical protein